MNEGQKPVVPSGGRWPLLVAGLGCSLAPCAISLFRLADEGLGSVWTAVGIAACALAVIWCSLLQRREVLFTDQVLPPALLAAGVLLILLGLVPGSAAFPCNAALLVASAALLAFGLRGNAPETGPSEADFPPKLLARPLSYLFVYVVVHGLALGALGTACVLGASGSSVSAMPVCLGAGLCLAALLLLAVRLKMSAPREIDLITRVALVVFLVSWLLMLQPEFAVASTGLAGLGVGLLGYLSVRMAVDLQGAFGVGRWLVPVVCAVFAAALAIGAVIEWLLVFAGLADAGSVPVIVVCIVAVAIVTVYGLSSERVWTASGLLETDGDDEAGQKKGPWQAACERVEEEHGLTRREREVFELLARGRNAAFIEQELVISNHTVKSHMLNIYRKLGIHSQQELIDMVEDARG